MPNKNKQWVRKESLRIRDEVRPYKGIWTMETVGTNDIVGPRLRIKDLKRWPYQRDKKMPGRGYSDTKAGKGEGGYRSRSGYILRPHNDVGGTTPMKESRPNLPGTMKRVEEWWDTRFIKVKLFHVLENFRDGETVTKEECVKRYVAKRSIRSEIRRSKKQLAVLHVTEDLPVRKALHFKVGFMNPECRRIVEAMGGTVELVPREDPLYMFPNCAKPS